MKADRIIRGRIYPADGTGSFAEAMAIGDGKILAVGSLEDLLPWAGSETAMEEKPGLIIPGITEGHAHVTCASEMVFGLALGAADSPEEYLEKIRTFRDAHPDADYIVGSGYDNGVFDRAGPTAALMDKAVSDVPVVMIASDHHSRWLNTAALQKTGITDRTPDPLNGEIVRDALGRATGWLKETAQLFTRQVLPPMSPEDYAKAVLFYQQIALSNGVTSAFEPMYDCMRDYDLRAEAYRLLDLRDELRVTFSLGWSLEADDNLAVSREKLRKTRERLSGCRKVCLNTAKFFADGVVECHTAFLREDYADTPGNRGELTFSPEAFRAEVSTALEDGFDVHIHVIGDAALDMALDALEEGQNRVRSVRGETGGFRNAVTHLQLAWPDQIARIKKLGVIAVTNPYWHYSSPVYYEALELPYLGARRAKAQYPMKSLVESRIPVSQASDYPVTNPPRTMDALHLMVNRRDPKHPEDDVLGPQECLSVREALDVLTRNGAYQLRLEQQKGSLEPGKDADFCVLSADPFTVPKEDLHLIEVLETWTDGILRYHRA
ncbi:MAG: amidohydrolase [Oscillospiraceae bacterium]|nr:amidohydrolase [Oscillospiraceae bacterium]